MSDSGTIACIAAQLKQEILSRSRALQPFIIALDGRCAAGKTTLAARLAQLLPGSVLHMDEFFLRPEQRSPDRLALPGGNVDWERFLDEVLLPLRQGRDVAYRPYSCHTQSLLDIRHIPRTRFILAEGSYSCHPELWAQYDLHIFLTVSPAEQLQRIRRRNGETGAQVFAEKWIPLEEQYFSALSIAQRCELVIDTSAQTAADI